MKRKPRSRLSIILVMLLGLAIFGSVYYTWNTTTEVFQPANPSDTRRVSFEVAKGDNATTIADKLKQSGLIRNPLAFRLWARVRGLDTHLQAGVYDKLSPSMTISQIIDQLLEAQPDATRILVKEGVRLEQIAQAFSAAEPKLVNFKEADFLNYTKHINKFPDAGKYPILKTVPANRSMEGLLFPATYDIPIDATAQDVMNIMLKATTDAIQKNNLEKLGKDHKLTLYQVFILASVIEREARFPDDRPGVASVYWNRIFRPNDETVSLLQADPTVQYARDSQKPPKTYWGQLQDSGGNVAPDSPWNTYTHQGWPPTPICSPGL
ncbi:MAG: endolytic transglycosylase MltG, partial [Ktedonobacteraceae bacterium]|nr:endolytic transglycosylase MltG [Ktedonobacteraceae bacterium]